MEKLSTLAPGRLSSLLVQGLRGHHALFDADAIREAFDAPDADAPVARIIVRGGETKGVVLQNGDEIYADTVISSLDPKRTFLSLCDADHLAPEFLWRIRRVRMRGTLAKVNLALSALPANASAAAADNPVEHCYAWDVFNDTGLDADGLYRNLPYISYVE